MTLHVNQITLSKKILPRHVKRRVLFRNKLIYFRHIPLHQARVIIRALKGATFSEELCFEEILKQLIKGKKIVTESITDALWKFYKAPSDDNTDVIAGKILSFIIG